jgi:hypothetical protein
VKTVLRSLFVWLLLLALPFQGVAAARMLPSVGAGNVAAAVHAAPSTHPCHEMGPGAAAGHTVDGATAADKHAADKHAAGKGHGACADCCIAVAPIPARVVPPAFAPPSIAIPFRAGHVPSVDPSLPERPPRFLAA